MPIYEICWEVFGTLAVEADDEGEAHDYASDALFGMRLGDVERCDVDGVDTRID